VPDLYSEQVFDPPSLTMDLLAIHPKSSQKQRFDIRPYIK
jgi:hypothetical protein